MPGAADADRPAPQDDHLPEGILDALPFHVLLVDSEHTILYANRASNDALGLAPDRIVGKHCPWVVHGTKGPCPACPVEDTAGRPVVVERELFNEAAGRWIRSAVYPTRVRSPSGRPAYVHVIQDIDARKRAEEALRERVALEELISRIATRFLGVSPDLVDTVIDEALRLVAEFLQCDRYAAYVLAGGGEHLVKAHEGWTSDVGRGDDPLLPACLPRERLGELAALDAGEAPPARAAGGEPAAPRIQAGGADDGRSVVAPILLGGATFGFARFDTLRGAPSARASDARLRDLLSSTLSLAFERSRSAREVSAYEEQLRSMALELSAAEQRERRQLAADLHDGIGQTLALSMLKLSSLKAGAVTKEMAQALGEIQAHIETALSGAKSLMFDLSPPVLHQLGLAAAIEWLLEQCSSRYGLKCELEHDGCELPLQDDHRIFVFRAVQELLNNVNRHARANRVRVHLGCAGDRVVVEVADDGVGIPASAARASAAAAPKRFGLFSIRERLRHLGGSLETSTGSPRGTRVIVSLPVSGGSDREPRP